MVWLWVGVLALHGFAGAAAVLMLVQVQALALDRRFGFAGAPAVMMLVQVQVLALDRRVGFAGAAAVLMLVQVQALALDWRFILRVLQPCWCWCFRFAGVAAVLVLALALGWRFVLQVLLPWCWISVLFARRWCRAGAGGSAGSGSAIGVSFCVMPGVISCHAHNAIMSCQG